MAKIVRLSSHDDQELVSKLQNDATREVAFKELFACYSKPLYRHIRNLLIDHDDTNDVLQNTFLKVFRHINNFKGESKLYSWLYRIATNESITFINQKTRKNRISLTSHQNNLLNTLQADAYFDPEPLTVALHKAIANLPAKQQLVFKMRYFEEIKYEDMSVILNTSVGALKASYHHAVKKIEEYMANI